MEDLLIRRSDAVLARESRLNKNQGFFGNPRPHRTITSERNLSTSSLANGIQKSCHEDMKTMMKSLGQDSGAVLSEAMVPVPGRANNFYLLHCSMRTWGKGKLALNTEQSQSIYKPAQQQQIANSSLVRLRRVAGDFGPDKSALS
ncbi:hypothetical protein E4U43_000311 [Claviceps pusilla]|uniref:Uncharacterized protein n=1 Tax=Claviceps pusilla TaxID=123648 RepID=A0A9P7SZU4_9HYPO|nr:hypothetical protein E4U43_000311 [Claviceps pusilla]